MKHNYIDQYSNLSSLIHRLDPRIKIITFIIFILFIILTQPKAFISFSLYAALIAILILLSKIPLEFIFKRSLAIIPFVLMVTLFIPFFKTGVSRTNEGLMLFGYILAKSYLSILCMILLVSSTNFPDFLKALEKLRCPSLITLILCFMYRYIFVIQDELMKMWQAKEARSLGGSKWFHTKIIANMVGALFIRSYERAEAVYLAMCSRGFTGKICTISEFKLKKLDLFFFLIIFGLLITIKLIAN